MYILKTMRHQLINLFLFSSSIYNANAQSILDNLSSNDSAAIVTLSVFPENAKLVMLVSCTRPEAIIKLSTIQKHSSAQFKTLVSSYSKEDQQKIWNLSSYPNLINRLGEGERKSQEELEKTVAEFPEDISETAIHFGTHHQPLLKDIMALNTNSYIEFETAIKNYPENIKDALHQLIKYPEIVDILNANMKSTVILGDAYKRQPEQLDKELTAISLEQAKVTARDYEEWKRGLQQNPQAQKEMEEATSEYVKEQGLLTAQVIAKQSISYHNYYNYNYPYWYGSPWWYEYPVWYHRPYYYDMGYYYSPQGIIYIGMPSPYYGYWYFHRSRNHYNYSHFSDYCVGYYHHHPRAAYGFNGQVHQWIALNEHRVPKNFFDDNSQRPERIKELGRFEIEYDKANKSNPKNAPTRDAYLNENSTNYPHLNPKLKQSQPTDNKTTPKTKPNQPQPRYNNTPQNQPPQQHTKPNPTPQAKPTPTPQPMPYPKPNNPPTRPQPVPQPTPTPLPQTRPNNPRPNAQPMPQQKPGTPTPK